MKYMGIILLLLCYFASQALTIEVENLGWQNGKERKFMHGEWSLSEWDLNEGTGKAWDFTTFSGPGYENCSFSTSETSNVFPDADFCYFHTQKIHGNSSTDWTYYKEIGTDISQLGYKSGYGTYTVWTPAVSMGFPHTYEKEWSGSHDFSHGTYTIDGKVIATGVAKTMFGTFDALLVRYQYSGWSSYEWYQWETREYGIVAKAMTGLASGMFVLKEAESNNITSVVFEEGNLDEESLITLTENHLTIASKEPLQSVSLLSTQGRVVQHVEAAKRTNVYFDTKSLAKGLYVVQMNTIQKSTSYKVLVK